MKHLPKRLRTRILKIKRRRIPLSGRIIFTAKTLGPQHACVEGQALFVQAQVLKKCKRYTSPLSVKPVGGQFVSELISPTGAGQAFLFPIAFAEVIL